MEKLVAIGRLGTGIGTGVTSFTAGTWVTGRAAPGEADIRGARGVAEVVEVKEVVNFGPLLALLPPLLMYGMGRGTGVSRFGVLFLLVFCFLAEFSAGGFLLLLGLTLSFFGTGIGVEIAVATDPSSPSSVCLRFFLEELLLGVLVDASWEATLATALFGSVMAGLGAGTPMGV